MGGRSFTRRARWPVAALALCALAGCGGEEEESSEQAQGSGASGSSVLELALRQTLVEQRPTRGDPAVASVTCEDAIDLTAINETYQCSVSGAGEEGELDVLVVDAYQVDYIGSLGGRPLVQRNVEVPDPSAPESEQPPPEQPPGESVQPPEQPGSPGGTVEQPGSSGGSGQPGSSGGSGQSGQPGG